jgi:predicted esterase
MKELRLPIRRSARYYVLGEAREDIRALWLVCHGYGQLARNFLEAFRCLDNGRNLIIAPEALSRFYLDGFSGDVGATWMTKEDRLAEIEDQRNYLDALYRIATHKLAPDVLVNLLGFSQGTNTAARWVASTEYAVDNLLLWAGDFPADVEASARLQRMNLYYVYGNRDPFLSDESIQRISDMSRRNAFHVNTMTFEGKHQIHSETLLQLERVLAKAQTV